MGGRCVVLGSLALVVMALLPAAAVGDSERVARTEASATPETEKAAEHLRAARRELRRLREPLRKASAITEVASGACSGGERPALGRLNVDQDRDRPSIQRLKSVQHDLRSVSRELELLEARYEQGAWRRQDSAKAHQLRKRSKMLGSGVVTGVARATREQRLEDRSRPLVPAGTGSISGTVTAEGTGDPLIGVEVDIYNTCGYYVGYGYTDGTGAYSVGGLDTGDYLARTYNYGDFIDELFDDIPCGDYCDERAGTRIAVTDGQVTSGIDFALTLGGSISGTITAEGTGDPLADVRVVVYNSSGSWIDSEYTDGSGAYSIGGLVTGSYFVRTYIYPWSVSAGYVPELYDDIPCVGSCDETTGTPIPVTQGIETLGKNFALALGGSISGTVTAQGTGDPLSDVEVDIYDSSGRYVTYGYTDGSGAYTGGGLPTGSYFARTYVWGDNEAYIDELYDGIPCVGYSCDETTGTPIPVTQGIETLGKNFALALGGTISGTVTAQGTGDPLIDVSVDIYDSNGWSVAYGYTDGTGAYSASGLPTGSYFARTYVWGDNEAYIDELYDDIPCIGYSCDVTTGTEIPVTQGIETTGKNFALALGGSISGTVTAEGTGDPLEDVQVVVYNSSGSWIDSEYTDGSGAYSIGGLVTGSYFARTRIYPWSANAGYIGELYDDIPCIGYSCDVTTGTEIPVTQGIETTGKNFALTLGGSISGTVTAEATGDPLCDVEVDIYDSSGRYVTYGYTDGSGAYTGGGLPTGSYFAKTDVWGYYSIYIDELYDNIPCPGSCDETTGTPIPVTQGIDTSGKNFALALGGSISGTVTAEGTGDPLEDVQVVVYNSSGSWIDSEYTDGSGAYSIGGLVTGSYFARTRIYPWSANAGYIGELYDDIPCIGYSCDVTTGTEIPVTQGVDTPGKNFALALGGSISGTVTAQGTGDPLSDVGVEIYDSSGSSVSYGYTDGSGAYSIGGLVTGSYYARTYVWGASSNYINELYDDITCLGWCDVTTGTPIPVTQGVDTSGKNFALALGGSISGTVTAQGTGDPLSDVGVEIYDSSGSSVSYGYTDGSGAYTGGGLPTGSYYARTYVWGASSTYINELYDDITCLGWCDVTTGTPIPVTQGVDTTGKNFALALGGSISGKVTDETTGDPATSVRVTVYDSSGNWIDSYYTGGTGTYSVGGLPTGNYFARTYSYGAFLDELYDDIDCSGGCDVTTGTVIPVIQGVEKADIDFALRDVSFIFADGFESGDASSWSRTFP